MLNNGYREKAFGRLLAIANVLATRVYEPGKPAPAQQHMRRFGIKPMSTFVKIHEDLMQYAHKFGADEITLLDMFDEILSNMEESDFTNEPLNGKFLHAYHSQQHTLNNVMGVEDAAEMWGLSAGTLKNYYAEGRIKAKKISGRWIIDKNQENPKIKDEESE